ncbi:hypothetical protein JVU11DRAFT_9227 [Chiua virens]|nr:hypothetical protein JVU11DRAFT_9227 [Chiua virens]
MWTDLLQHVRHGNSSCRAQHIEILRSLIITNPSCPPTDFTLDPWKNHVLVTPMHSVRRSWNEHTTRSLCKQDRESVFPGPPSYAGRKVRCCEEKSRGREREEERVG